MISVTLSTFNRGHLLERSLTCYATQVLDQPFELIIVDDDSTDDTASIVASWAKHIDIKYLRVWKNGSGWRDCAATINMGIRATKGNLVIPTHPEVMPGPKSLQALWDNRQERTYMACKVYYLTPNDQAAIETVPWALVGAPAAVRTLPNFYKQHTTIVTGNPDYAPQQMDRHASWGSWVFGGFMRDTWRWFGGFTEFNQWGSIDVDFLNRRSVLGIPSYTAMEPETFCVHQNHDVVVVGTDVLTPRDMDKAMTGLPVYTTREQARLNHI